MDEIQSNVPTERQIPAVLVPLLKKTIQGLQLSRLPVDFWTIEHGPTILDGFCLLASELKRSDIANEALPHGYAVLASLFSWESACQFDGWGAFGNIDATEFENVLRYFSEIGLIAEAESLHAQMAAYESDPQDLAMLNQVAEQTRHALSNDLDRLEYITQVLCDNAKELLYQPLQDLPSRPNQMGVTNGENI